MDQLDRVTGGGADDGPWEPQAVAHSINELAGGIAQLDSLAVVVQLAQPRAKRRVAELGLELRGVVRDDDEGAAVELAAVRNRERDGALDHPAAEVDRLVAGVVQFDELGQLGLDVGIVVDFIDHHRAPGQGGQAKQRGSHEQAVDHRQTYFKHSRCHGGCPGKSWFFVPPATDGAGI